MRVARIDLGVHETLHAGGIAQDVDRLRATTVPTLEEDRLAPECQQSFGLPDRVGLASSRPRIEQARGLG